MNNLAKSLLILCHNRYIRAFEVGRSPTSSKYDPAIRLRTAKNGPAVRNRVRLSHAVNASLSSALPTLQYLPKPSKRARL